MEKIYDSMGCYCGYVSLQEDGRWLGFNESKNFSEIYDSKSESVSYVKYGV